MVLFKSNDFQSNFVDKIISTESWMPKMCACWNRDSLQQLNGMIMREKLLDQKNSLRLPCRSTLLQSTDCYAHAQKTAICISCDWRIQKAAVVLFKGIFFWMIGRNNWSLFDRWVFLILPPSSSLWRIYTEGPHCCLLHDKRSHKNISINVTVASHKKRQGRRLCSKATLAMLYAASVKLFSI